MRDGSILRCRYQDSGALLSVYIEDEYDVPVGWSDLRTIVDIGAHIGAFTVRAGLRSPKARILAVEPNPAVFVHLQENVEANRLSPRTSTVRAAIGAREGRGTLSNPRSSLGARVVPAAQDRERMVEIKTLESLLSETGFDRVDLLKVDCEGSEYEVFFGAGDSVLERITSIVCEYHPAPAGYLPRLCRRFEEAGFHVERAMTPLGVLTAIRR